MGETWIKERLAHIWHGPFRVKRKVSGVTYEIEPGSEKFLEKIHISRMKPFISKYERPTIPPDNVAGEVPGFDDELPVDSWEEGQKKLTIMKSKKFWKTGRPGKGTKMVEGISSEMKRLQ